MLFERIRLLFGRCLRIRRHNQSTAMAQYGKTAYWDERYTKDPEPFDWYQRYSGVRDLVNQYVKREDLILMAGCGNSRMTEEMFEDGTLNDEAHASFPLPTALHCLTF